MSDWDNSPRDPSSDKRVQGAIGELDVFSRQLQDTITELGTKGPSASVLEKLKRTAARITDITKHLEKLVSTNSEG